VAGHSRSSSERNGIGVHWTPTDRESEPSDSWLPPYEGLPDVQSVSDEGASPAPPHAMHLVSHFEEALGGAVGFIEFDIDSLDSPFVDALKAKQFVIEVGPLEDHDPAAVERVCRKPSASPGSISSRISSRAAVSSSDAVTWFRSLGP